MLPEESSGNSPTCWNKRQRARNSDVDDKLEIPAVYPRSPPSAGSHVPVMAPQASSRRFRRQGQVTPRSIAQLAMTRTTTNTTPVVRHAMTTPAPGHQHTPIGNAQSAWTDKGTG